MCGAIPPLPNTPSWRGAQLKHRDTFTTLATYLAHRKPLDITTSTTQGDV
jgi:hypothetical protein